MAKSKSKKDHKKRVAKRNNLIQQERKQFEKAQKEMLMKLIDEEKQRGMFNNPVQQLGEFPNLGLPTIGGPSLGLSEGPKF